VDQVHCGVLTPSRHNMQRTRRNLRSLQGGWVISSASDSSKDNENDDDKDHDNGETGSEPRSHDNGSQAQGGTKYHILNQLRIDLDNKSFINSLVRECFALQREHNPGPKATNEYRRPNLSTNTYAISVSQHMSDKAYERYHRKKPYIK
jgi:hypothetical protein